MEPYISYSHNPSETQGKSNCLPTALYRILKKWYQLKGKSKLFPFDELKDFEDYCRFKANDYDGGIATLGLLKLLKKARYFKDFAYVGKTPKEFHEALKDGPFLVVIRRYEDVPSNVYKVGEQERKTSHAMAVWGWDGDNFKISDPNRLYMRKLNPENFDVVVNAFKIQL